MVTAGIKNNKIHGAKVKKGVISAKPLLRMLNSPSKIQRNKPFKSKKIAITKYPTGAPKKDFISLNSIDFIIYFHLTR